MCGQNAYIGNVNNGNDSTGNRTFNPLAAGSIPARPTSIIKGFSDIYTGKPFSCFSPNQPKISLIRAHFADKMRTIESPQKRKENL